MKQLLLAGATGLVGGHVLDTAEGAGHQVTSVGRRSLGRAGKEVITDFSEPIPLPTADAAICTLGTTLKTAGSRTAFYAVDHDAVINFAISAQRAGVNHFLVVTSVDANARAAAYYPRVKGETERDLEAMGFSRLDIVQPGLLLGQRSEKRTVEQWLQRLSPLINPALRGSLHRYRAISAKVVANALVRLCEQDGVGIYRHENQALEQL
ncbi:MAG: NAD-dependent epimerase/dehydratase family protein [Halieaceae bacterium]|jgi:uncharacterized protein YbjT (DUF2867 family)|nr:NAD-dependent epimerase/dehydratase family protein [Halieaceae bacterium]